MLNRLFDTKYKNKYISRENNIIKFNNAKQWHISSPFKIFYKEKEERENDIKKFTALTLCGGTDDNSDLPYFDQAIESLLSNPKFLNDIIV